MNQPLRYTLLPPHVLPHFGTMQAAFNEEEVDRIKFFRKIIDFQQAQTSADQAEGVTSADYRICEAGTMPVDQNTQWLWDKIGDLSASANYDLFLYDIEYIETIDYLVYEGNGKSKYDWHIDTSYHGYRKYDRKISGIVMLSDPEEYEGGRLLVDNTGSGRDDLIKEVSMKKGDVTFFDSNYRHCVEPVTSGLREVLVFWIHGKNKL